MWSRAPLPTLVALAIGVIAAALSWGYVGLWWNDYGVWLHQVERVAAGEVLYRDLYVSGPPLGFWVMGFLARIVGTDLLPVWLITHTVFIGILLLIGAFVARVAGRDVVGALTAAATVTLALGVSRTQAAPLSLGGYSPASTIGALVLLAAVVVAFDARAQGGTGRALLLGVLGGLAVLAKHDFWPPAAYLVLASTTWPRWLPARTRWMAPVASALVVATGAAVVVQGAGWERAVGVVGGHGMAALFGFGRALPSWERVVAQLGVALAVVALVRLAIAHSRGSRADWQRFFLTGVVTFVTLGIYATITARVEPDVGLRALFTQVRADLLGQAVPFLLLIGVTAWLLARRAFSRPRAPATADESLALFLLGLALAARLRRGFEGPDWFHVALEVPAYVVVIRAMWPALAWPLLVRTLPAMTLIGMLAYWTFATGPLTQRGALPPLVTDRGTIRVRPNEASDYVALRSIMDQVDPTRTTALAGLGNVTGMNYFLGRHTGSPLTYGFTTSVVDPDTAVALLRAQPMLLLEWPGVNRGTIPVPGLSWSTWRQPTQPSHYVRFDRAYFDQVRAGCERAGQVPATGRAFFVVYQCPARAVLMP